MLYMRELLMLCYGGTVRHSTLMSQCVTSAGMLLDYPCDEGDKPLKYVIEYMDEELVHTVCNRMSGGLQEMHRHRSVHDC